MAKIYKLSYYIIFIILKHLLCVKYCGVGLNKYQVKFPPLSDNSKTNNNRIRRLQTNNFRPIKIYLETSSIDYLKQWMSENINELNKILEAVNYVANSLQKIIKVRPLNYKISIRNEDLVSWSLGDIKEELKENNGVDKDLIIFMKITQSLSQNIPISNFDIKYIDQDTKRPIVGIITLNINQINFDMENSLEYIKIMILHQFTHILGFYNETFPDFITAGGNISKIITTTNSDERSQVPRTYIHSPKVLEYAKKYYNCNNIKGVDLEDQDDRTNSHWESRVLLGEYMNSEPYYPEQVISEFTLALLEDSGWYEINYYTGGLMRFGKNKGCNFLIKDCLSPSEFKNEFFNSGENKVTPACSSGRLGRAYCDSDEGNNAIQFLGFEKYNRFAGPYGTKNADFCLVFNSNNDEIDLFGNIGNCKYGNSNYGAYIKYSDGVQHKNGDLPKILGEKYDYNSFCILSSVSISGTNEFYKFNNNIIHPMCYPIFCSDQSLTIKVYEQYIVCPRSGGKIQINGIYEGFIFCPDYNLICTGTVICNNMFDCIDKESEIKNNTYEYNYEILTNQIKSDLINEYIVIGFELSENGKCPKFCEQCKDIKKCFKCKNDYNLIGFIEDDENPIICNDTIDVTIGYYQNNITKVYYNCTEFCEKCNKTHCSKCNNIHKLNENNKLCIDKVPYCEQYNEEFNCIKCRKNYAFIGNNRDECFTIDISKYYTLDDGISYFPCNNGISHCEICNNDPSKCVKCEKNYYFLENNRTYCRNDKDLSEYFSDDDKISYYPCNTSVEHCQKCNNRNYCTKCFNNLYLIFKNNVRICSETVDDTYYTDDGGKTYYLCSEAMNNCEKCNSKDNCLKCFDNYGLLEKNKNICVYIADNKYYTEDGSSYYLCSKSLPLCEKCSNKNNCLSCKENSYFIEFERNKCYNDKNLSKYYTTDNGFSYFLCENNCDTCYNNSICKTCISNYYFVGDNRNKCYKIDIEKYYSLNGGISYLLCSDVMDNCEKCNLPNHCKECENNYYFVNKTYNKCYNIDRKKYFYEKETNSYFPCNLNINNCEECFNNNTCNKCIPSFILLYESPNKCQNEIFYINDKTYFKLNDSFYEKCSTSMPNCKYCNSINNCEECEQNYYFLDKNYSKCVSESELTPSDEFFRVDDKNFYSCSYREEAIDHCKKCTNGSICIQCKDEYAFVSDNLKECISKKELEKKYYHNSDGTIFYPCIKNCDICENSQTCIECSPKYISIYDDTQCELLEIEIINIENELNESNEYISNYINSNKNKISKIVHYVNNIYNYTITIFQIWEGTSALLEKEYFKINTKELTSQISKKYNIAKSNIIYYFISKYYNNYLEIYNKENGQKLDLNNNCPECINTGFEITNNYRNQLKNEVGNVIFEKINQYNIDIFNKGDIYVNDICKNLNIAKIDLSIKDKRKYFNYGDYSNEIICTDKNCEIQSNEMLNFTGICKCLINTDFNNFKNTEINILISSNEIKSYDSSIAVFKCFKSGFNKNISSNTGFYLFLIFIIIQILNFVIFIIFENTKISSPKTKKTISNPPYKSKDDSLFIENFDIIEEKNNLSNFQNNQKDIQDKDDADEYIEEYSSNENGNDNGENDDDNYTQNSQNSQNTKLEEIKESTNKEITTKAYNMNEKIRYPKDSLLDINYDDDNLSKNKFISKNFKKINIKYNLRSNENIRDYLLLDKNKNKNKNKNKKNKMSESFYLNTEGNKNIKSLNFKQYEKLSKLTDEQLIKTFTEKNIRKKERLINLKDNISSIKRSIIESPYNLKNKDIEKFSFCGFYWYLLGLKQPILNLTSEIKMFKITESFIPSTIKTIRFIFMIALNFFINALLLSQKYFSNKFNYFDKKYNFRYIDLGDIPTSERFSYSFGHTAINSLICFLICFVIQSILNYFYFNIRNKINEIIDKNKNDEEMMIEFLEAIIRKYKFLFMIDMILMIFFFCYMINYSAVYIGGDLDYISAGILTFIFLQVFPFIICLILASIRYLGLKVSSEKLSKISQIFAY